MFSLTSKEQRKKKVLIIDDEKNSLKKIRDLLAKSDFTIVINNNPTDVAGFIISDDIDAVIAEFHSGNADSERCVKEIKRIKGDSIPIVLLSSRSKKKQEEDLVKVAEYTGMTSTSSYDLKGLVKSLTKELSDFQLIDPDDFTSIEVEGQIMSLADGNLVTSFTLIEYSSDEFWIEISNESMEKGGVYRFQVRLIEKDLAIDLDFEGKIEDVFDADNDKKLTLQIVPLHPEGLKGLDLFREKLEERQDSIVSFLNKTKGLE